MTLEGASLLFHLEHDVVHARQVLLRGLELQFGRTPAALVLRHAGGFLEQLAPLQGPSPEDLSDLALLDDCVRLEADSRIHQEVLDIAQSTDLPVDEVLTLARPVEPAANLDIPGKRLHLVQACRELVGQIGDHETYRGSQARIRVGFETRAEAAAIPSCGRVSVSRSGQRRAQPCERRRHLGQLQANLGGRRWAPPVAAAEDHVLHPLATETARTLLSEHPRDGVDDIALAAAVRTHDGRDTAVKG